MRGVVRDQAASKASRRIHTFCLDWLALPAMNGWGTAAWAEARDAATLHCNTVSRGIQDKVEKEARMNSLTQQHCMPYGGEAALSGKALVELHRWARDWHVITSGGSCALQRDFSVANFAEALAFTDRVGALAKAELHFPEITTEWGRVQVRWWTHAIRGLHRNDFIMAAKTDALYEQMPPEYGVPVE